MNDHSFRVFLVAISVQALILYLNFSESIIENAILILYLLATTTLTPKLVTANNIVSISFIFLIIMTLISAAFSYFYDEFSDYVCILLTKHELTFIEWLSVIKEEKEPLQWIKDYCLAVHNIAIPYLMVISIISSFVMFALEHLHIAPAAQPPTE